MRWVIGLLIVPAVWMAFMLYFFRPLPAHLFFGGFFLAIGITNLLSYKTTGRRFFEKTQVQSAFCCPRVRDRW